MAETGGRAPPRHGWRVDPIRGGEIRAARLGSSHKAGGSLRPLPGGVRGRYRSRRQRSPASGCAARSRRGGSRSAPSPRAACAGWALVVRAGAVDDTLVITADSLAGASLGGGRSRDSRQHCSPESVEAQAIDRSGGPAASDIDDIGFNIGYSVAGEIAALGRESRTRDRRQGRGLRPASPTTPSS